MEIDWELVGGALELAVNETNGETIDGTDVPVLAGRLAAAVTVWEHGGSDQAVAAALLHDGDGRPLPPELRETVARRLDAEVNRLLDAARGLHNGDGDREARLVADADALQRARRALAAHRS